MSKINWAEAPEGAMFFNGGEFWRVSFSRVQYYKYDQSKRRWTPVDEIVKQDDYEAHPILRAEFKMLAEWFENEQA